MIFVGFATGVWTLSIALAIAGFGNAMAQPAANQLLSEGIDFDHQGLAFGIKQAAIPIATLMAGLAVPVVGLTIGWRWAFLGGGGLCVLVAALVRGSGLPSVPVGARATRSPLVKLHRPPLFALAIGGALAAAAANAAGVFAVSTADAREISVGVAGHVVAIASLANIGVRIAAGWAVDTYRINVTGLVSLLMLIGSVGFYILALPSTSLWLYAVGLSLAFSAGWGWPGLFHLAIVRQEPNSPAAATGFVQSGVFLGGVVGPAGFGIIVAWMNFRAAWTAGAVILGLAAVSIRRPVVKRAGTNGRTQAYGRRAGPMLGAEQTNEIL